MTFIFFHGSFSTPQDAWFPWLKLQLEQAGHQVIAPQFPVDVWKDVGALHPSQYNPTQNLTAWYKTFEEIKDTIINKPDLSFIGHSIGPLFILYLVEKYGIQLKYAYFVAPFFHLNDESAIVDKANASFYKTDFDFPKLRHLISRSTVFYSDDDPYVGNEKSLVFARKLNSRVIALKGLGHMGIESNMSKFPELLEIIKQDAR